MRSWETRRTNKKTSREIADESIYKSQEIAAMSRSTKKTPLFNNTTGHRRSSFYGRTQIFPQKTYPGTNHRSKEMPAPVSIIVSKTTHSLIIRKTL